MEHRKMRNFDHCLYAIFVVVVCTFFFLDVKDSCAVTVMPPSNLKCTPAGKFTALITWSNSPTYGITFNRVEGCFNGFFTVNVNEAEYGHYYSGLIDGTYWYFRMAAYIDVNNVTYYSSYTESNKVLAPLVVPTFDYSFVYNNTTETSVTLKWTTESKNTDHFEIEKSLDNTTWTHLHTTSPGDENIYLDNEGISPATVYYYRIRGVNDLCKSEFNVIAVETVVPDITNLAAAAQSTTVVKLSWEYPEISNKVNFNFEYKKEGESEYRSEVFQSMSPDNRSGTVAVEPATKYYFRIRASVNINNAGEPDKPRVAWSAYSPEASCSTPDVTKPVAPSSFTAVYAGESGYNNAGAKIRTTWKDNSTDECNFVVVDNDSYVANVSGGLGAASPNTTSLEFCLPLDQGGRTYNMAVIAKKAEAGVFWDSDISNIVTVTLPLYALTSVISQSTSDNEIKLEWTDTKNFDREGYRIYRSENNTDFTRITSVPDSELSFADQGLKPGTKYFYKVSAFKGAMESPLIQTTCRTMYAPPVPPVISWSKISDNEAVITWSNTTDNETSYTIYRRDTLTSGYFSICGTTTGRSYAVTNITSDARLEFAVTSSNQYNNYSESVKSNIVKIFPPLPKYGPNSITASVTDTGIKLLWTVYTTTETGYLIQRSTSPFGPWVTAGTTLVPVKEFVDNASLPEYTDHYYRVCGYNEYGNSNFSDIVTAKTRLNAPSGLDIPMNNSKKVVIKWTDNSSSETAYVVERKSGENGTYAILGSVGANVTSFTDSTVVPATLYFYRVTAKTDRYSLAANSSSPISVTTPSTYPGPVDISLDKTNGSSQAGDEVIMTMTCVSDDGSDDIVWGEVIIKDGLQSPKNIYTVYCYTSGGTVLVKNYETVNGGMRTEGTSTLAYLDSSKTRVTKLDYSFKVELHMVFTVKSAGVRYLEVLTCDRDNNIVDKNVGQWIVHSSVSAPQGLAAVKTSSSSIDLSWSCTADNETSFEISRQRSGETVFSVIGSASANAASYTDSGLSSNTAYTYRVRSCAYDYDGTTKIYSSYSNTSLATTDKTAPAAPSNLKFSNIKQTEVTVSWSADYTLNEEGFIIKRRPYLSGEYVEIGKTGVDVTCFVDTNVVQNTKYEYSITAYNTGGESGRINGSVTTLPRVISLPSLEQFVDDAVNPYILPEEYITYTVKFKDDDGMQDITSCGLVINFEGTNDGVFVTYDAVSGALTARTSDDEGTSWTNGASQGVSKFVNNLYAVIDRESTSVNVSSQGELTMTIKIAFTKYFTGKKDVSAYISDSCDTLTVQGEALAVLVPPVFIDLDSDTLDEIVVNNSLRDGLRVIKNGSNVTTPLHSLSPDQMIRAHSERAEGDCLVVDFGRTYGVWMRLVDGTWELVHRTSPEYMTAADIDGDGLDEVIIDFGESGVYAYFMSRAKENRWEKMHAKSPRLMVKGDVDADGKHELIIDFGAPYGIWIYNYGAGEQWFILHNGISDDIVTSDSDSDGYDEITIDFGERYGLWRVTLNPALAQSKAWQNLHNVNPRVMEACDMDGDGRNEIIVDFFSETTGTEYGIYALDGRSGWVGNNLNLYWDTVHSKPANTIGSGKFDGTSIGDELLVDFGPQLKKWVRKIHDSFAGGVEWYGLPQ